MANWNEVSHILSVRLSDCVFPLGLLPQMNTQVFLNVSQESQPESKGKGKGSVP